MAYPLRRPYLAILGLALGLSSSLAAARGLFESQPLPAGRVIAVAQPLAGDRWNLVLLEQLRGVHCWQRQADGGITSLVEQVRHESLCRQYRSSSAYTLRVAGNDLTNPWRLRIEAQGDQLQLQATSPQATTPILLANAPRPAGPNQLQPLELQPGWNVERRSYGGRPLSHLYLSNAEPLPLLLAKARSGGPLLALPPAPPPTLTAGTAAPSRRERERPTTSLRPLGDAAISEVIALQVVPFRD